MEGFYFLKKTVHVLLDEFGKVESSQQISKDTSFESRCLSLADSFRMP